MGATPLEFCFECFKSEYNFLVFTFGGRFSSGLSVAFNPRILPRYRSYALSVTLLLSVLTLFKIILLVNPYFQSVSCFSWSKIFRHPYVLKQKISQ